MAVNKKFDPNYIPPGKRIFLLIKAAIFFPAAVSRRLSKLNKHLGTITAVFKLRNDEKAEIDAIRRQNTILMNFLVRVPLVIGISMSAFFIYNDIDMIRQNLKKMTYAPRISIRQPKDIPRQIKRDFEYRMKKSPIEKKHVLPFLVGYLIGYIGSLIMSNHVCFKFEKSISKSLFANKYIDENGRPWEVCYTPKAIMFITYQCEPEKFVSNGKFWDDINFKPDREYQQAPGNSKVVLIKQNYELPAFIDFSGKSS